MTGEVILGIVSLVVAIGAMVRRNFVRAVIFGLFYPCLLFVWPPSSLLVELVIVMVLMGIDWLFASVEDDD